jgi:hypothetical protein
MKQERPRTVAVIVIVFTAIALAIAAGYLAASLRHGTPPSSTTCGTSPGCPTESTPVPKPPESRGPFSPTNDDSEITTDDYRAISPDTDHDGVLDVDDTCPLLANPSQRDADGDGVGDACTR